MIPLFCVRGQQRLTGLANAIPLGTPNQTIQSNIMLMVQLGSPVVATGKPSQMIASEIWQG